MLNVAASIICLVGTILQWNRDWALFTVNLIFTLANGYFAVDWIIKKIKNRKRIK